MPVLRKQKDDGSEEEIPEEELYRYTRYRWLCNGPENLAVRYRKFNISALVDATVNAVGDGARPCVKLLKCIEGQYNKAFIMTMDNGVEVLAKIPNPNAGPVFYTTASEVATRHFLRTVLNLPISRIYAYSSNPLNPVGVEYIIEEKAEDVPLGTLWYQWQTESQVNLVTQLVDFETELMSLSFRRHGCIYYKKDLEKKGLRAYDLEARPLLPGGRASEPDPALVEDFALGPLTEARLWEGDRATMELDRGPWSSPLSYMAAMGINETQWAKAYAKPRINPQRSLEEPESPDEYISLLDRYLQLVPHLSPPPLPTSLSHQDLHLNNIFIDPDTKKITCIIDWQSASISEPLFQHSIPRLLLAVGSRTTNGRLDAAPEEGDAGKYPNRTADLLGHYQHLTKLKNEQRWTTMNVQNRSLLTELLSSLCGAWSRNDTFSFRHALISIAARWGEIAPATTDCPILFTEKELELHNSELELAEGLSEVLHQLQNDNLIPLGGMVLRENYDQALHINNAVRAMFVNMAESESQKVLHSRVWPYQDQDS
ncbi:kinase-like domain-containing protein [Lineolata rhizophorae]|uniref:Kinase-like domain-containing protein n=1 Tax=Lineolata rhizophorae TaxID=578093 RepID=A0A6A6NU62_9PEZI|nr:kinase-like domain-containing protein [Lineolata rhizophorae]